MFPSLLPVAAQASDEALGGYWANAPQTVIVRIAPCADEGWCGTIQWASDKAKADAARRGTTTLIGTELMHGFVLIAPARWKGRLYVPDLNRRSKAELRQLNENRLEVRGCTVGGLICKSQVWTRAEPR